MEWAAAI